MTRLLLLFLISTALLAQETDLITHYEQSAYKETPRYDETVAYAQKLAQASPLIHYTTFGKSPQGRDLPLLIVNKDGRFTPQEVRRSEQLVYLIQACIHAGESDGKEAGFLLLRDLIRKPALFKLLDHVTILFIPIFNVDGHERFSAYSRANQNGPEEMGWRTTAQNLNLNRDHLKADAPEMQAWLRLFHQWLPDFLADCHVTNGADYQYVITYKIDQHGIMDQGLIDWVEQDYLPPLRQSMAADGFPLIEYVTFRKHHDMESGMTTWAAPPRFSDGYSALQNRPGLLIETHMFKDYRSRVNATYAILKHSLVLLNNQHQNLKAKIARADQFTAGSAFREQPYTLTYRYTDQYDMIDFLGYEYEVVKSDLSGGDWHRYFTDRPKTYQIPFYRYMEADEQVALPQAYIIPPQWTEVIARIKDHGIAFKELAEPVTLEVDSYVFSNPRWTATPYEGRHTLRVETRPIRERRIFPAGSIVIPIEQRAAKVIAHILEPKGPDSFVHWGFFNSIFEQKEYVESYVMEERARLMLAGDKQLREEFETKLSTDSSFAQSPRAILNWFYKRSPYWDEEKDKYPVGKLTDRSRLDGLKYK
jgi:hypothetical protein